MTSFENAQSSGNPQSNTGAGVQEEERCKGIFQVAQR